MCKCHSKCSAFEVGVYALFLCLFIGGICLMSIPDEIYIPRYQFYNGQLSSYSTYSYVYSNMGVGLLMLFAGVFGPMFSICIFKEKKAQAKKSVEEHKPLVTAHVQQVQQVPQFQFQNVQPVVQFQQVPQFNQQIPLMTVPTPLMQ
ncbi:Hypothetical_protein [Hexamita inflata]|uniref:Hypothetical_protein n=1 Tax=Hexamita inflata TaxID=28002 RepID=A0AA86TUJ2_9EUKA|nr:Hypothetical protein HINF_LOCUS16935 [Hexamita inflata]